MDKMWTSALWMQFGAAIDMLGNAIDACPESLWGNRSQPQEFWYVVFHTLFWLDLYLSGSAEGFTPPSPYTLDELDPAGLIPERVYTKGELRSYLSDCRQKCQATIENLTEQDAQKYCQFPGRQFHFGELLLYNMRHVQEHASQLSLILGQQFDSAPGWVSKAKDVSES